LRTHAVTTALAVVASLTTAGVSEAKPKPPKPVCNLVTDPAGDVVLTLPGAGPQPYVDTAVDIRSVDVVSDNEGLGVTLRVGGLGTSTSSTHTDLGMDSVEYWVFLTIESGARELGFHAQGPADNASGVAWSALGVPWTYDVGRYLNDAQHKYASEYYIQYGAARGAVDEAKSEIRISVSWADLKKYGYSHAKKDRAVKVRALTRDWWFASNYEDTFLDPGSVRYGGAPHDEATSTGAYPLGAKSCAAKVPA
jgi:hypothetical protein